MFEIVLTIICVLYLIGQVIANTEVTTLVGLVSLCVIAFAGLHIYERVTHK